MSQILINGVPQSGGGGGGSGDVVSSSPVFTGSILTTYVATVGNVINTTIAGNTSSVAANEVFTLSGAPGAGLTWIGWRLVETGGVARTITIPSCLSLARGSAITSFTLNPFQVAEIRFVWNGSGWEIIGEPATAAQIGYPCEIGVACSDETTALTTGTGKVTFRTPFKMNVTTVKGSLTTAQTSGSIFTVDINEAGASILSTKLTIDNTEKTSVTAAAQPVISDSSLADDAEMTVDIDQIGDGTAKGLKIWLIGTMAV